MSQISELSFWISLVSVLCILSDEALGELCPEGEPVNKFDVHEESSPSIYDDLTTSEITALLGFMKGRHEFNIIDGDRVVKEAILNCTYIYHMERLPPPKQDALAYLDHNGPKPERFALVILLRGDTTPPGIEEYKVGPLPGIQGYERMSLTGQRDPIEFIKRNYVSPADLAGFNQVARRELAKVDDILERETGGYRMNNVKNGKELLWLPGVPGEFKSRDRSMWMFIIRHHEGFYIHPIGLQFRITPGNSLDPKSWSINFVWFRGQSYANFEDMAARHTTSNSNNPPVFKDDENLFSSLNQRGGPLPEKNQRGPRAFMPDGRRYTVSGHHVEWQGWTFDFNLRSVSGLQLHDVRFKGERIAYELALSEIGIMYSGASPSPVHTAYVDSAWYIGMESFELFPDLDCPDYATFFDFAHFMNFKPIVFPNSVCLFEHARAVPLRRHLELNRKGSYHWVQGMPGNVLIIRTMITVENYEYILDHTFHQNGALEVSISLSGYLLTSYYTGIPGDDRYGFQIREDLLGQMHNHLVHFKVDLDILGTSNRFETLDAYIEDLPDPARPEERIKAHAFRKNLRRTEKTAAYKFNFDTPKYLVFYNNEEENGVGNKRGYRLHSTGMTKQLLPEGWAIEQGFSWSRYQVAVTKQKDSEPRASSIYNVADLNEPYVDFQKFIDDDESIVDEDLVAWVSLGSLHIPHSEDLPIVQTPSLSLAYYLLPFNYFDEDPSLASRDNIRVDRDADGQPQVHHAATSGDISCQPRTMYSTSAATVMTSSAGTTFTGVAFLMSIRWN